MGFGGTLVSGIQDISALLPILGTDQCEAHIGAALSTGYFYAAATPLSIFGCLGIVKAALGILIATISLGPFAVPIGSNSPTLAGAAILCNAGFELQGAAAAMIGVSRGDASGMQYLAASKLEALLANHVDNSQVDIHFTYWKWNIALVLWTCFWSLFAMTPYVAIIVSQKGLFTTWLYPLLRIVGSSTCAVVAQFMLQIRIRQILEDTRDTLTRANPRTEDALRHNLKERYQIVLKDMRAALLLGIGATTAGYVGCFTVVQSSSTRDTIIWVAMEAALSVLRVYLWGLNVGWDNETYFTLHIRDTANSLPLNTTGLSFETDIVREQQKFIVYTELPQFLTDMGVPADSVRPYISLNRDITTYYATAYSEDRRTLYLLMVMSNSTTGETLVVSSNLEGTISSFSGVIYNSKTLINVTPNPFVILQSRRNTAVEPRVPPHSFPLRVWFYLHDWYSPIRIMDDVLVYLLMILRRVNGTQNIQVLTRMENILSRIVPQPNGSGARVDNSVRSLVRARVVQDHNQRGIQPEREHLRQLIQHLQDTRLRIDRIQVSWSGEVQRAWASGTQGVDVASYIGRPGNGALTLVGYIRKFVEVLYWDVRSLI